MTLHTIVPTLTQIGCVTTSMYNSMIRVQAYVNLHYVLHHIAPIYPTASHTFSIADEHKDVFFCLSKDVPFVGKPPNTQCVCLKEFTFYDTVMAQWTGIVLDVYLTQSH